jgi:hypothetical protein
MKFSSRISTAAILAKAASAGTTVWDGSFSDSTATELSEWSWSNQVGSYQYYIHGSDNITEYVNIGSDNGNGVEGAKISLTDTAYWEGQTMRRTELIPQTSDTSAITSGTLYYHFSIKRSDTNAPSVNREHQIAFFESHFTEMKAGWISGESDDSDSSLRWFANSQSQWNVTWEADVWHNIAYEIDFDSNTVGLWYSTGSDALTQAVAPVTASVSSNGADWHVGVLELSRDGYSDTDEDFYFSGVYIESGDLTTAISGGSSSGSSSSGSSSAASSAAATTTSAAATTSSATTLVTSTKAATTSLAAAAITTTKASSSAAVSSAASSSTSAAAAAAETTTTTKASAVTSSAQVSASAVRTCKKRKAKRVL